MNKVPKAVLLIAGMTLLLAFVVQFDLSPWVRGGFGWRWPFHPVDSRDELKLLAALAIYAAGAFGLVHRPSRPAMLLGWAFLGTILITGITLGLRDVNPFEELVNRTLGKNVTGIHWAASRIDWSGDDWVDWWAIAHDPATYSIHVSVAPPGLPLLHGAFNGLLDQFPALTTPIQHAILPLQCHNYDFLNYSGGQWGSAVLGLLLPLWAGLTVLPLYALARRMLSNRWASMVVLWWPLIPALHVFGGTWYTAFPLVVLTAFWFLYTGLNRHDGRAAFVAAGLIMGLATFSNYAFVPQVGLMGFYTLVHYGFLERQSRHWTRPIRVGLWYGIGLALPWLLYWVFTGAAPWEIFRASFDLHLELERQYLPWVFLHPWDWMLWNGFGVILVWLWGLGQWRNAGKPPLLGIALVLMVIVLSVSGTGRGESGRVWLMFTPFALLAAGEALSHLENPVSSWRTLTLANLVLTIAVIGVLDAVSTGMTSAPEPPMIQNAQTTTYQATFQNTAEPLFQLTGWQGEIRDDQKIALTLHWQAKQSMYTVYWFGAQVVAPDGTTTEPVLWQPREMVDGAGYPTTCWPQNTIIEDTVYLPLPADAPTGDWWVSLAAFGDTDQPENRLTVALPDGTQDIQVGLGPVIVEPES